MYKYWIKLYHEILDDPKMGRLPDKLWRRIIEIFLLAGDNGDDGILPAVSDMAWRLRISEAKLRGDLQTLADIDIIEQVEGDWIVKHFQQRQGPSTSTERSQRRRAAQRKKQYDSNENATDMQRNVALALQNRLVEPDIDIDIDKHVENESAKNALLSASADYHALRKRWKELFPNKPQPRSDTKSLIAKVKTRMKSEHFYNNWEAAMLRATQSSFCNDGGWFDFGWFVANDQHYERCLNGNYDNRPDDDGDNGQHKSGYEEDLLTNQPFILNAR